MENLPHLVATVAGDVWTTIVHNWPYLLLSVVIASVVQVFLNQDRLASWLRRRTWVAVLGAVALGALTPFCSCGTTAVVLGALASSVPWAPIVAFMASSPLTSPEEYVMSVGLFGPAFATTFFVAAIVVGLLGGAAAWWLEGHGYLNGQSRMSVPTATTQAGAGTVDWLRDAIAPGMTVPDFITQGLAAEAASTGLFFLPYLTGERSPWWNPHASGVMAGLRRHHGRAEMTRAALEGVAFGLALCMEPLVMPDEPVDIVGGGAASDGWLQLFADVWERPVRRRANTSGVTSLGVAITGLVGLGHLDFASAPSLSVTDFEAEPSARASEYREHRQRFVAAYIAAAPWFEGEAR